jgi:DNA-binding NarL/FixJ family response regulator
VCRGHAVVQIPSVGFIGKSCCGESTLLKIALADYVIAAVRDAAGTASLSPELLTRLTQAIRRPPPPDPFQPLSPRKREVLD